MKHLDRRQFNLGGIAAGALLAAPRIARAAPVKIRCGWVVIPASLAPLVLEKKDILKHFGQSYVAEATRFEGTPPVITALASGDLDIGPLAFSSFGLAIQNARMDDLRDMYRTRWAVSRCTITARVPICLIPWKPTWSARAISPALLIASLCIAIRSFNAWNVCNPSAKSTSRNAATG